MFDGRQQVIERHDPGGADEGAQDRGVHDGLGGRTESVLQGNFRGVDGRDPKSGVDAQPFGRIRGVDHHPAARPQPGQRVGGVQQRGIEHQDVVRLTDVLADEEIVARFGDPGKGNHRGSAPLDAVVGVALHVPAGQKGGLGQRLRGDYCALPSTAV